MLSVSALLIGVGTAALIAGVLAALAVAAEATIANYGEVELSVNGGARRFAVRGGQPLLSTLKEQGVFVPSACGGRGSCGLCKLTVEHGAGEVSPTEAPWLGAQERAGGVRLSCQVKVKRSMAIRLPEALFSVRQYRAEVVSLRDLTYDIREVTLALRDPAALTFRAGQYVQLEIPAYELSPEPVYRAYSIACPPSREGQVELEIRRVPNGVCTTYVFTRLAVGDALLLNGPHGDFSLRDTDRDIIFIAGGSGMAPIKSMLLDMADRGIGRRATYFFGARAVRDLFLREEMRALEESLPAFRFVPALSEPQQGDAWNGETGLITQVLARGLPAVLDRHEAYLCGSPGMIDASVKVLRTKGLPEDLIYYDKFM